MPLMGFQIKKKLDRGVGGWVELYPNYFWIFGIFLTLQSPLTDVISKMLNSEVECEKLHGRNINFHIGCVFSSSICLIH